MGRRPGVGRTYNQGAWFSCWQHRDSRNRGCLAQCVLTDGTVTSGADLQAKLAVVLELQVAFVIVEQGQALRNREQEDQHHRKQLQ